MYQGSSNLFLRPRARRLWSLARRAARGVCRYSQAAKSPQPVRNHKNRTELPAPVICLALAVVLTGCAASEPRYAYVEPSAGPHAFITFHNATPGRAAVALYENAETCTDRRHLPDLLLGEEQTVAAPAGKPLAFTFRYTIPNRTPDRFCEVTASLATDPEARYEAALRPHGDNSCTVELARIERDAFGNVTRSGVRDAKLREPLKSRSEAGPFCVGSL